MKRPAISDAMKWQVVKVRQCFIVCDKCKEQWPIQMVQFDHHLALIDGGTHDNSNIRPICVECHKPKSATEHKNNAKAKRLKATRTIDAAVMAGELVRAKSRIPSRPFPKRMKP